ncbi:MAG: phosphomannomutase/phosphoglucomutase [Alphaproteobacteria bacterium]|nr:phosphomannomutase/phosphoglucomutase [Alphaproteobacteria bacterium]MCW5739372.1 phosphomannomutase/phosphoglucomutase [Alphaproteobacteria bacterium]
MTVHVFDSTILREYDIRGIVGQTLKPADAQAIGRTFGTMVRRAGGRTVALGYDGRLSSPSLQEACVAGLREAGIDVLRIGMCATPMLYFAVYELDADGGIMITGSHNPPDYNGFKMMFGKKPFYGADIQKLGAMSKAGDVETGAGSLSERPVKEAYVARVLRDFKPARPLRVVWDTGHGAMGVVIRDIVSKLPGEHTVLFERVDGTFPAHHPDPTVEKNLLDLRAAVKEKGADVGIAFDGDGDRIGALDGQGRVLWGDQLLAIWARDVLKERPGSTIIADVKASQVLFDEVAAAGGKPLMWKTGHSLLKVKMAEEKSPLAGEMSGHVFFADRWYGFDDAMYAGIRLLNIVGGSPDTLATMRDRLPQPVNTPELRFDCAEDRKFKVVEEVKERLKSAKADVNDVDGVRVSTGDGWWLLRASNTQAVLVARCEAGDQAGLERLMAELKAALSASGVAMPDEPSAGH